MAAGMNTVKGVVTPLKTLIKEFPRRCHTHCQAGRILVETDADLTLDVLSDVIEQVHNTVRSFKAMLLVQNSQTSQFNIRADFNVHKYPT